MATTKKPFVVTGSHPVNGHVQPVRLVASELVRRGYEVTSLLPEAYRESFEKAGVTFVGLTGIANYTEKDFDTNWPERKYWPSGLEQIAYRAIAPARAMFRQSRALQGILRDLRARDPTRSIVIVQESWFMGTVPILLRLPDLIYVPVIALGVTPLILPSQDFPVVGIRAFPDTSPEGRAKVKLMTQEILKKLERPQKEFRWVLEDLGLPEGTEMPSFTERVRLAERHFQMCIPSLELPRTDMPANLRFAGGVPAIAVDDWKEKPEWWDEIAINAENKDIIAVTQGTMDIDYTQLIVPTIEALRNRPNTIVVAVLGIKGATLPPETSVPANTHVMDYVPYTELLKHTTLFVTNGGYNGVQQSIGQGVPILKAGLDGDKGPTGNRLEWAGCGLDLWVATPTVEQVRVGIETVLKNPKYKARALEMQEEAKKFDAIDLIVKEVDAMAKGKHSDGTDLEEPSWTK